MDTRVIEWEQTSSVGEFRRVSWGAIFAGVVLAIGLQLLFGLLGLAFGLGAINPATEAEPFRGIGVGAAIWFAVTTLLTLFVGGWVASRLSSSTSRLRGAIHGATAWSLATLASFYLLTTAVGGVLRATGNAAGGLMSLIGQGAGTVVSEGVKAATGGDLDFSNIEAEARDLMSDSGQGTEDVSAVIRRALAGRATGISVDRDALVTLLVNRAQMSREDAENTVNRWEQTVADARQKFEQAKVEAEQQARSTGQAIADGTSKAAAWTSALIFLGLLAAALGGWLGSPATRREHLFVRGDRSLGYGSDISSAA